MLWKWLLSLVYSLLGKRAPGWDTPLLGDPRSEDTELSPEESESVIALPLPAPDKDSSESTSSVDSAAETPERATLPPPKTPPKIEPVPPRVRLGGEDLIKAEPKTLIFDLVALPDDPFRHRGIYGKSGDIMPRAAIIVQPEMAVDLMRLEVDYKGAIHWSDLRRSAAVSLHAVQTRKGALPPGYSHHNFGGAGDTDAWGSKKTGRPGNRDRLADLGLTEMKGSNWKPAMDELLAGYNLLCHRKDGKTGHEDWHYDHGVAAYDRDSYRTRYTASQLWIDDQYGDWWKARMTTEIVQIALNKLGFRVGEEDGVAGRKTRAGIAAFQKKWRLTTGRRGRNTKLGFADTHTKRTLAFCAAEVRVTKWADFKA